MITVDGALDAEEYRNIKASWNPKIGHLIRQQSELDSKEENVLILLEKSWRIIFSKKAKAATVKRLSKMHFRERSLTS